MTPRPVTVPPALAQAVRAFVAEHAADPFEITVQPDGALTLRLTSADDAMLIALQFGLCS